MIKLKNIAALLSAALFTACGMLEFETEEQGAATGMILSPKNLYVLVGDTFRIETAFEPDTLFVDDIYWSSEYDSIAAPVMSEAGCFVANGAGTTSVTAMSVYYRLIDHVSVIVDDRWETSMLDYPLSTVVYAHPEISGRHVTDGLTLGAFIDGQLRGVGKLKQLTYTDAQTKQQKTVEYVEIRIYGDGSVFDSGDPEDPMTPDKISFRCYDKKNYVRLNIKETLTFDGETHGSPTKPFVFTMK